MIPASALGGKGGDGDTVVGSAPIHVDRAGNVVRVSHDLPDIPDPAKLNRYGNVDEWGHLLADFHPHGGRDDLNFEAQDIAGRKATLSGEAQHPDYAPGVFGNAWGGTPAGDFWFKTIGARDGITTTELVYNRQSVEGNIKYFTDGISVGSVLDTAKLTDEQGRQLTEDHRIDLLMPLGDDLYYIAPRSDDGDTSIPFKTDDLLIGYFRHDGVLPTATYLRVLGVFPSGFVARRIEGLSPKEYMVLARRGSYSDPARQNSAYVDGKIGKMVFLRGVNDTAIRPDNLAVQVGYIGDIVDPDFPDMTLEEVGLYGLNARLKGDFILRSGKNVATEFTVVEGKIESAVSSIQTLDGRVTQEVSTLTQTASDISLSVRNLSTSVNGRIDAAESRITVNAQGIEQKIGLNGVISANEAGFPTGGAVFIALQPVSEHLDDTTKHITAEERGAWNAKYTVAAVDEKIAAALATAKAYADEKTQVLSNTFTAALADAVAGLQADIQTAIRELIDNAPEAMNSLKELSTALGDNPNFATEIATALGQRVTIEALKAELANYVPKTGDTTIAGTITATDFKITE